MSGLDIDHLRRWIGREERVSDIVTAGLVARFEATLGGGLERADDVAPPGIHWCLAPPAAPMGELGADGHPAWGGFLPPVSLPRRMWAGGEVAFHRPLRVGAEVTRVSRIADVAHKSGRSGELVFVTVDHEMKSEGATAITERQDIVYRAAARPGTAGPEPSSRPAGHSETVEATTTLLFRYSALTFNGHRIHYDIEYARGEEGYPGLVVHGPLQATLMLRIAARVKHGVPPRALTFRGARPLFAGARFTVNAVGTGTGLDLWCADAAAAITMTASARW